MLTRSRKTGARAGKEADQADQVARVDQADTETTRTSERAASSNSDKPKNPRNYVVWLLSRREWSESELLARLRQRGLTDAEAQDAVTYAKGHGFQSDERFAEVKARTEGRRRGNRAVSMALQEKGIAPALIAEQLDALPDERERVLEAARRFEGATFDLKLQQKAYRYLASRGFSSESVKTALKHLKASAAGAD